MDEEMIPDISRQAFEEYKRNERPNTSVFVGSPTLSTSQSLLFSNSSTKISSGVSKALPRSPSNDRAYENAKNNINTSALTRRRPSTTPGSILEGKVNPLDILSGKVKPTLTASSNKLSKNSSTSNSSEFIDSVNGHLSSPKKHFSSTFTNNNNKNTHNSSNWAPPPQIQHKYQSNANPTARRRLPIRAFSSTYKPPRSTTTYGAQNQYASTRRNINDLAQEYNIASRNNFSDLFNNNMEELDEETAQYEALGITGRFKPRVGSSAPLKLPALEKEKALLFGAQVDEDGAVVSQQQRFAARNQAVLRARALKQSKSHTTHRNPQKYVMVGMRAPLSKRQDMSEEELLQLEKLELVPAPELFFGKGISASSNQVRRRQLQRGQSRNGRASNFSTERKQSIEIDNMSEDKHIVNIVIDTINTDHKGEEEEEEEAATRARAKERSATTTPVDLRVDDNFETVQLQTGWEGTELDQPVGSLLSDDEEGGHSGDEDGDEDD
eukprot:m.63731 g.63731  ORF g.63731 m.63731 type:complete len:496 (-) comp8085_c4_seq1:1112-2599(-)